MSREEEYRCLVEFLAIYRRETCLWNVKSAEYRDRVKKDVAYGLLVDVWKAVEPDCTKLTIVKKINNLRCSYRKEFKKVNKSIRNGSSGGDIYVPKLWYYNLLEFLHEQETPRNDIHTDDESSEIEEEHTQTPRTDGESLEQDDGAEVIVSIVDQPSDYLSDSASRGTPAPTIRRKKHKMPSASDGSALTNDVLLSVQEYFKKPRLPEDRFDVFGKMVAIRLRELHVDQKLWAEKFISDVLFEGERGNLDGSCVFTRQVGLPQRYQSFSPTHVHPQQSYNKNYASTSSGSHSNAFVSIPPKYSQHHQNEVHDQRKEQQQENGVILPMFSHTFNDVS